MSTPNPGAGDRIPPSFMDSSVDEGLYRGHSEQQLRDGGDALATHTSRVAGITRPEEAVRVLATSAPGARVDVRPDFSLAPRRLGRWAAATILRRPVWTPVDQLTRSEVRRIVVAPKPRSGEVETRVALAERRRRRAGQRIANLLALHRPDYKPSKNHPRTHEGFVRQWIGARADVQPSRWRNPRAYRGGARQYVRPSRPFTAPERDHIGRVRNVLDYIANNQAAPPAEPVAMLPATRKSPRGRSPRTRARP